MCPWWIGVALHDLIAWSIWLLGNYGPGLCEDVNIMQSIKTQPLWGVKIWPRYFDGHFRFCLFISVPINFEKCTYFDRYFSVMCKSILRNVFGHVIPAVITWSFMPILYNFSFKNRGANPGVNGTRAARNEGDQHARSWLHLFLQRRGTKVVRNF